MAHGQTWRKVGVAFWASIAWVALCACSSAVLPDSNLTVICAESGSGSCRIMRNFPSTMRQSLVNECTNGGGSLVASCTSAGLVGCCTDAVGPNGTDVTEVCYYSGDAANLRQGCGSGTWSTTP